MMIEQSDSVLANNLTIRGASVHLLKNTKKETLFQSSNLSIFINDGDDLKLELQVENIKFIVGQGDPTFCPVENSFVFQEKDGLRRFFLLKMMPGSPFGFILEKYLKRFTLFQKISEEEQKEIKDVGGQSLSDFTASGLRFTGEVVGTGLKLVGSGIAKGIELGGKLYESSTEKGNSGTINESTKKNVSYGTTAVKALADGTGVVVGAIGHGARYVGDKVGEQIRQTETYKEWKEKHADDESILSSPIAKGAIAGLSATLSGLNDGVSAISDGIKNTTIKVVEHKHGNDYAEVTKDGFEIAGGVTTSAKNLLEWSHIWLYAGIEMTVNAISSPPAQTVLYGGTWKEGFLSIYDEKLGWRIKYSRLKSRSLVFYNGPELEHEPTGILPLVAVRIASQWKESNLKKPGLFRIFTHKIKEWILSTDCSDDVLKRQPLIDPLAEALDWEVAINALLSVQQCL